MRGVWTGLVCKCVRAQAANEGTVMNRQTGDALETSGKLHVHPHFDIPPRHNSLSCCFAAGRTCQVTRCGVYPSRRLIRHCLCNVVLVLSVKKGYRGILISVTPHSSGSWLPTPEEETLRGM
ncbi:hypothetical protein LY76DRAFT_152352 [Colletotrichum caudatum]|nr:hypothetical protein LY76DRAFT_152352 [Colletotrichum caudatum]